MKLAAGIQIRAVCISVAISASFGNSLRADDKSTDFQAFIISSNELGCDVGTKRFASVLNFGSETEFEPMRLPMVSGTTAKYALDQLAHLRMTPSTTLVVYFAGHGEIVAGQHALYLDSRDPKYILNRNDLVSAITALRPRPRLAILITDCCSSIASKEEIGGKLQVNQELFKDLFLRSKGFVNITSAEYGLGNGVSRPTGSTAWSGNTGPVFTVALVELLNSRDKRSFDSNKDGLVDWTELWPEVKSQTSKRFNRLKRNVNKTKDDQIIPIPKDTLEKLNAQSSQVPMIIGVEWPK